MRSDRRPFVYLLAAIVGVFVAHVGDYVAVFPHAHARGAHLAATGHNYWPAATVLAAVAAIALLAAAVSNGVRRGRSGASALPMSVGPLSLFQVVLFVGIEVVERLPFGLDAGPLFRSPEFLIGVLSQFLVAALVCRFTRTVERVAAKVASRHGRVVPLRAATQRIRIREGCVRLARVGASPLGSRAPPSLSLR